MLNILNLVSHSRRSLSRNSSAFKNTLVFDFHSSSKLLSGDGSKADSVSTNVDDNGKLSNNIKESVKEIERQTTTTTSDQAFQLNSVLSVLGNKTSLNIPDHLQIVRPPHTVGKIVATAEKFLQNVKDANNNMVTSLKSPSKTHNLKDILTKKQGKDTKNTPSNTNLKKSSATTSGSKILAEQTAPTATNSNNTANNNNSKVESTVSSPSSALLEHYIQLETEKFHLVQSVGENSSYLEHFENRVKRLVSEVNNLRNRQVNQVKREKQGNQPPLPTIAVSVTAAGNIAAGSIGVVDGAVNVDVAITSAVSAATTTAAADGGLQPGTSKKNKKKKNKKTNKKGSEKAPETSVTSIKSTSIDSSTAVATITAPQEQIPGNKQDYQLLGASVETIVSKAIEVFGRPYSALSVNTKHAEIVGTLAAVDRCTIAPDHETAPALKAAFERFIGHSLPLFTPGNTATFITRLGRQPFMCTRLSPSAEAVLVNVLATQLSQMPDALIPEFLKSVRAMNITNTVLSASPTGQQAVSAIYSAATASLLRESADDDQKLQREIVLQTIETLAKMKFTYETMPSELQTALLTAISKLSGHLSQNDHLFQLLSHCVTANIPHDALLVDKAKLEEVVKYALVRFKFNFLRYFSRFGKIGIKWDDLSTSVKDTVLSKIPPMIHSKEDFLWILQGLSGMDVTFSSLPERTVRAITSRLEIDIPLCNATQFIVIMQLLAKMKMSLHDLPEDLKMLILRKKSSFLVNQSHRTQLEEAIQSVL